MFKIAARIVAVGALIALGGCASIVSKSSWPVTIQSTPTEAKCTISKQNGVAVQTGLTPMTVTLSSSDGYFSRARYILSCQKDGYEPALTNFEGSVSGWYAAGNLVFGGLIGYLIVDPATGAMYKLDETYSVALNEKPKSAEMKPAVVPALEKDVKASKDSVTP